MSRIVEITPQQARASDALRRKWPGARVVSHAREWGVILEVRVNGHAAEFVALTPDGAVVPDHGLRHAA
jgi:hypothetical protein